MSQQNVDTARAIFGRLARGDFSRMFAEVTDDFEFVASPEIPDAGTYRGKAAREWITAWAASFSHTQIEAKEIIDAGPNVLVGILQRGRPRGGQAAMEGRWWLVMTLRGGLVSRIQVFPERTQALEAAGPRE
jgi:ketosteroid isomerase-like protein